MSVSCHHSQWTQASCGTVDEVNERKWPQREQKEKDKLTTLCISLTRIECRTHYNAATKLKCDSLLDLSVHVLFPTTTILFYWRSWVICFSVDFTFLREWENGQRIDTFIACNWNSDNTLCNRIGLIFESAIYVLDLKNEWKSFTGDSNYLKSVDVRSNDALSYANFAIVLLLN